MANASTYFKGLLNPRVYKGIRCSYCRISTSERSHPVLNFVEQSLTQGFSLVSSFFRLELFRGQAITSNVNKQTRSTTLDRIDVFCFCVALLSLSFPLVPKDENCLVYLKSTERFSCFKISCAQDFKLGEHPIFPVVKTKQMLQMLYSITLNKSTDY